MGKNEILRELVNSDGRFVSGQALSRINGTSRAAVWKAVKALIAQGYVIESRTNAGYRLVSVPDRYTKKAITDALGDFPDTDIVLLESVDSTNTYLKRLALEGAKAGTAVVAESQVTGRGRFDRTFFSPPGKGIYLSLLLRPSLTPKRLMVLTAFTAVAVMNAIETVCGFRPQIKWTNDLVWMGKKLCGILTELSLESETGRVQYAVVGIGINVNQDAEDFPGELSAKAASLKTATGRPVSRELVIAELIKELRKMAQTGLEQDRAVWLSRYRQNCMTIGRKVYVERAGSGRRGTAISVNGDAALIVRFEDGSVEAINSGEVSVSGLYGYA